MNLRIKIITPICVEETERCQRQERYHQYAAPNTQIDVYGLSEGPTALDTREDILYSIDSVFREGVKTNPEEHDAILVDCVLDPAVTALQENVNLPSFGPLRTTLSLISIVVSNFSIIARTASQCQMLTELVESYGFSSYLLSTHSLGLTPPQYKDMGIFTEALQREMRRAIEADNAQRIIMGSTTMTLPDEVAAVAEGVPLIFPGRLTLRAIEMLAQENLLAR